jgi:hypothetical protein
MSKYYRVLQDTPGWDKGAILQGESGDVYRAISDLWNTKAADMCDNYYEASRIVENSPKFFEQVYQVSVLGKAKYLAKDAAKKAHEELHKPKPSH